MSLNAPISTTAYFRCLALILSPYTHLVFAAFIVAILAGLWTGHLERGLQGGVTTALMLALIMFLFVTLCFTGFLRPNEKWARRLMT